MKKLYVWSAIVIIMAINAFLIYEIVKYAAFAVAPILIFYNLIWLLGVKLLSGVDE